MKLSHAVLSTCLVAALEVFGLGGTFSRDATAKTYAALAVVPQRGRVFHGYAKRDSIPKARAAALLKCANKNCIVVQVYKPPQCAHLVLGNNQIFWNNKKFGKSERSNILGACKRIDDNCFVIVTECLN